MKLSKTDQGIVLNVYVKPDSRGFRIQVEDDELVLYCTESPVKGKVNKELIKELSKVLGKKVEIISGFTSRQKRILVKDSTFDEVNCLLSRYKQ